MGFFSELKQDLTQAVDELNPDEMTEQDGLAEDTLTGEETESEAQDMKDTLADSDTQSAPETSEDLSKMLDQMDLDNLMGEEEQTQDSVESVFTSDAKAEKSHSEKRDSILFSNPVTSHPIADETSVITAGMKITGDISSQGSMDVIGDIVGNVDIMGKLNVSGSINGNSKSAEFYAEKARITGDVHSEGSLKIGQSSIIIGNIFGSSAVIAGAVKGDIDVHGPVILDTSAIVMGNIKSKSVQINNGAVIEGMCSQCYADVNPTSFFDNLKKKK